MSYVKGDKKLSFRSYNIVLGIGIMLSLICNILMYQLISNIYPNLNTVGQVLLWIALYMIVFIIILFSNSFNNNLVIKLISFFLFIGSVGGLTSFYFVTSALTIINIVNVWTTILVMVIIILLFEIIQKQLLTSMNATIIAFMIVFFICEIISSKFDIFTTSKWDYVLVFWATYWIKNNWQNILKNTDYTLLNAIKYIYPMYYCTVSLFVCESPTKR